MTLADLAALGSLVRGIAVVFSFMFLALQMRRSSKATGFTDRPPLSGPIAMLVWRRHLRPCSTDRPISGPADCLRRWQSIAERLQR